MRTSLSTRLIRDCPAALLPWTSPLSRYAAAKMARCKAKAGRCTTRTQDTVTKRREAALAKLKDWGCEDGLDDAQPTE